MFPMYITHVEANGPFLKIYGQPSKVDALKVEQAIIELQNLLQNSLPPSNIVLGSLCVSRYKDGKFYRSRILHCDKNGVTVNFIDYGNEEVIPITHVRSLDIQNSNAELLRNTAPQADDYLLARIFGQWSPDILRVIKYELCNDTSEVIIESKVDDCKIIGILFHGRDYTEYLIADRQFGNYIDVKNQIDCLTKRPQEQNIFPQPHSGHKIQEETLNNPTNFRFLQHNQPNSAVTKPPQNNIHPAHKLLGTNPFTESRQMFKTQNVRNEASCQARSIQKNVNSGASGVTNVTSNMSAINARLNITQNYENSGIPTFKTDLLPVGTIHDVYCSYVEDGPNLFSIQLKSTERELEKMMVEIERTPMKNLSEKPCVGMACIARYAEDGKPYRAVIMNIHPSSCLVSYVDYGNTATVSYPDMYAIPPQFLIKPVFAMRFTLAGYKLLSQNDKNLKDYFRDLVTDKELRLEVMPLETHLFVNYCAIYLDSLNVLDELKKIQTSGLQYKQVQKIPHDFNDTVIIRYVHSPQKFYVQLIKNIPVHDTLMDKLLIVCQNAKPLKEIKAGMVCAAKLDSDIDWYRGQVIDFKNNRVLVNFVDYGKVQEMDPSALRELNYRFVQLEPQAIECCLKGFEKLDSVSETALSAFEILIENEKDERKHFKLCVIDQLSDSRLLVNLFDESVKPPINIAKSLCKHQVSPKDYFTEFQKDMSPPQKRNFKLNYNPQEVVNSTPRENNRPTENEFMNYKENDNDNWNTPPDNWNSTGQGDNPWNRDDSTENKSYKRNDDKFNRRNNRDARVNDRDGRVNMRDFRGNRGDIRDGRGFRDGRSDRDNRSDNRSDNREMRNNDGRDIRDRENREKGIRDRDNYNPKRLSNYEGNKSGKLNQSNTKKTTPRQPKNFKIKGKEMGQGDGPRNNYERKNISSDTSGKFSHSSRNTRQTGDSWESGNSFNQPIDTFEVEEYMPPDYQFELPNVNFDQEIEVTICWWLSPLEFCVQLKSKQKILDDMMRKMQIFYNSKVPINDHVSPSATVIARYNKDNSVNRARVLDYNAKLEKYKVMFVDFGNKSVVTKNEMFQVEKKFTQIPAMAIQCKLSNSQLKFDNMLKTRISEFIDTDKHITCKFMDLINDTYNVQIKVNGMDLLEMLRNDGLVIDVQTTESSDVNLVRLIGQTINIELVSIEDLKSFKFKLKDCETIISASYFDSSFIKENPKINEEFKKLERTICAANVVGIEQNKILLLKLYTPLLNEIAPVICPQAITTDSFYVIVTHVENINILYIQKSSCVDILTQLLQDMFEFYESGGVLCEEIQTSMICAVKSEDGNWYRSEVTKITNDDVTVRYIDYGNCERTTKNCVKILDPIFYTLEALGTKVYLPLECSSQTSNEVVIKEISTLTADILLTLNVIEFYNNNWIVDICSNGYSLIDVLKDKQLATRTDIRNVYHQIGQPNETIDSIVRDIEEPQIINKMEINSAQLPLKEKSDLIPILISHVDSPDRFFAQLISDEKHLQKLQENLQIVAQSLPPVSSFHEGKLCIARYSIDGMWYRARIIDSDIEVITLQFIDYGNTDVITDNSNIKEMNEAFSEIKDYSFHCSLPISPKDGQHEWPDKANQIMLESSNGKCEYELIAKNKNKYYIRYVSDGIDVAEKILSEGLGMKLEVVKSGEKCFISHINSLSDFYIQLERSTAALELISDYLRSHGDLPDVTEFTEGLICAAQFPEDLQWYRAKILFHGANGTEVMFIDYGNTAFTSKVKLLSHEITKLPFLSIKCSLELPNNILKWSEKAENEFQELAAMGATIFVVELVSPGESATVNLLMGNGCNILDKLLPLCDQLASKNLDEDTEELNETRTSPPGESQTTKSGHISHINSPNDFYMQFNCDQESLEQMVNLLQEKASKFETLANRTEGTICAALFREDDCYYRAKILSTCTSNEGCDVLYIDYGNTSYTRDLRRLPNELVDMRPLALHCALSGSTKWNVAASNQLYEASADGTNTFDVTIIDDKTDPCYVQLFINSKNLNFELMELLDKHVPEDNNLNPEANSFEASGTASYGTSPKICINENINENSMEGATASLNTTDDYVSTIANDIINHAFEKSSQDCIGKVTDDLINNVFEKVQKKIQDNITSTRLYQTASEEAKLWESLRQLGFAENSVTFRQSTSDIPNMMLREGYRSGSFDPLRIPTLASVSKFVSDISKSLSVDNLKSFHNPNQ